MNCLTLESNDPYFNLAVEEYLLKNKDGEYFILGINNPAVIIGKHQSPHREINTKFISEEGIPVIRRISGGGTVFHDTGNLNFTFIKESDPGRQVDFPGYTKPIIEFLSTLGVDAKFEGKNDLKVNGLKISGNAEHVHRNRVLHHGTLLFSTSLELMKNSLRKDTSGYKTRAVLSNPSSVTNLSGFLPSVRDIFEFRTMMMTHFIGLTCDSEQFSLSDDDIIAIQSLADSKYRSWEWNYGYGPEYQIVKHIDYQGINTCFSMDVRSGIIRWCSIAGHPVLENIAEKLIGCRHMVSDIKDLFRKENISDMDIFAFF